MTKNRKSQYSVIIEETKLKFPHKENIKTQLFIQ